MAAVEGGGTRCRWAVFDPDDLDDLLDGAPPWRHRGWVPTHGPEETVAALARALAPHAPDALGLATFGPLRLDGPARGITLDTPKPGWRHAPIGPSLSDALGIPVAVETDVNAAALAEARRAPDLAASGPVVYVTVGTGVGFGVVVDGRPLHGRLHPEAGHLPMPARRDPVTGAPDTFAGACPFHGRCLEGLASGPAIEARTGRDPASLAPDHPAALLAAGYLGVGLAAAVLFLAPARLVVGGGVGGRDGFLAEARRALDETLGGYLPGDAPGQPVSDRVVGTAFGDEAGLVGAALLAAGAARGRRPSGPPIAGGAGV